MSAVEAMFMEVFEETERELQPMRDADATMIRPLERGITPDNFDTTAFQQRRRTTNKVVDLKLKISQTHFNKNKNAMKIKLQCGETIGWSGERQTVIFTDGKVARIAKPNGETTLIPAQLELYFRLALGGDKDLQNFLTTNALSLDELNEKQPGEEKAD